MGFLFRLSYFDIKNAGFDEKSGENAIYILK